MIFYFEICFEKGIILYNFVILDLKININKFMDV